MIKRWLPLGLAAAAWLHGADAASNDQQPLVASKKPNFVFILTDDQDLHMGSLEYMPLLKKYIADHGTTYSRHYCVNALCCPSRVNLWTGRSPHNTNVTDVNPPHGGYPKFVANGFNSAYLPIWLQEAGYATYYTGKLFNAQTIYNYDSPHAAGWTGSDFLLDPYTYEYMNATFQRNTDKPVKHEGQYSTDVIAEKAYAFLDDGLRGDKPFFLGIAPIAPHCNIVHNELVNGNFTEKSVKMSPPVAAKRHEHMFSDAIVPRTPHFNPDEPNSVAWIKNMPKQNQTNIDYNDDFYRHRLRSLQAVDEIVQGVVERLEAAGELENTFVIYSTDNGYHIGQHRLQPGKQCAFQEDVNIPLIIRGPGIPEGATYDTVTTHTDLAPTLLKIAGVELREDFGFDGEPIPVTEAEMVAKTQEKRSEHVNVEMWGIIMSEGKYEQVVHPNHTYKALRLVGEDYHFLYTLWCSGEHELYDILADPHEMHNLYPSSSSSPDWSTPFHFHSSTFQDDPEEGVRTRETLPYDTAHHHTRQNTSSNPGQGSPPVEGHIPAEPPAIGTRSTALKHLLPRLDTLLAVLRTCKGIQCTHPWLSLHPAGDVRDLHEALDPRFDDFYEKEQERVYFLKCEQAYIEEVEGPKMADVKIYRDGMWPAWT